MPETETIIGPRRQPFLFPGQPPPGDELHVMTVAVRRGETWVWLVRDGGDRWRVLEASGALLGTVVGYDAAVAEATQTASEFGEAETLQRQAEDRRQAVRTRLAAPRSPEEPEEPEGVRTGGETTPQTRP